VRLGTRGAAHLAPPRTGRPDCRTSDGHSPGAGRRQTRRAGQYRSSDLRRQSRDQSRRSVRQSRVAHGRRTARGINEDECQRVTVRASVRARRTSPDMRRMVARRRWAISSDKWPHAGVERPSRTAAMQHPRGLPTAASVRRAPPPQTSSNVDDCSSPVDTSGAIVNISVISPAGAPTPAARMNFNEEGTPPPQASGRSAPSGHAFVRRR